MDVQAFDSLNGSVFEVTKISDLTGDSLFS